MWALYIIGSTQTGREWEGLEGLAIASLLCAIVSAPLMFLVDGNPPSDVWLVGGMVGLLSSVIPYSAELVALRTMSQHTFSVMLSLEPGAAAFAAFLVIDERLTASQWGAIGLVVLASAGVNLTRPERVDAPLGLDAA